MLSPVTHAQAFSCSEYAARIGASCEILVLPVYVACRFGKNVMLREFTFLSSSLLENGCDVVQLDEFDQQPPSSLPGFWMVSSVCLRLCRSLRSWPWISWSLASLTSCCATPTMLCTNKVSHLLPEYLLNWRQLSTHLCRLSFTCKLWSCFIFMAWQRVLWIINFFPVRLYFWTVVS